MEKEDDGDVVKSALGALRAYLHSNLPLDKDFFNELGSQDLLSRNTASELAHLAGEAKKDCVWNLVTYMEKFYTEEILLKLCDFLDEYAQQAKPRLATIASRIRLEILKHKPQLPPPVPEDTLLRRAGAHYDEEVLYPVIPPIKEEFSELVSEVFFEIEQLNKEKMGKLHTYLSTLLEKSSVPETVDKLKEYLGVRWNELNPDLLRSIVKHLKNVKLTKMMTNFQRTLSKEGSKTLSEFPVDSETVQPDVALEETQVSVKIDQNPDQQKLEVVFYLCNFFHTLRIVHAMFIGFQRGCTVLFFSIPTECVRSLPASCLLPSNLSLLEEWKVLSLSVKGAFTVYIKERRIGNDSLDKHSLLSSMSTRNDEIQTRVQQMKKDPYFKEEELMVMDKEVGPDVVERQARPGDDKMSILGPLRVKRSPPRDDSSASKSNIASIVSSSNFLSFLDHFLPNLKLLSVVLGIEKQATPILQGGSSGAEKCVNILGMWLSATANPTWELFCSLLQKYKNFNHVRSLIVKKKCCRKVTQDEAEHTLTSEDFDQLKQFKVMVGSLVWVMLGVTGAGKSCLGNFILGQDKSFPESIIMAISETEKAALKCSSFDNENLCVIDTPGLGDTGNVGSFKSDAEGVAYDYSKLATELTKVMMMMDQGINAFLIVVPAHHREYHGLKALLDFFDIIGAYWNHSILVVTHGKEYGNTEEEQYATYREKVLVHPKYPALLKNLLDKVSDRLVIAEAKDGRNRPEYHRSVVGKIMKYSKEITEQHGPFKDELQSIGRVAYEKAKLELRNEFEDMNSREAQAAVFRSTFKLVRDVVHKLVCIKMADGEDVDKMKKMAKVKEEELNEVREQRDILDKKHQEQQLKRKEAEEKQRQEEEKRRQAEERQRQEEIFSARYSPDSSAEKFWKALLSQSVDKFEPGTFLEVNPGIISYETQCSTRPNGKALIYVRESFKGLLESIMSVHNTDRALSTTSDHESTTNTTQDRMESNTATGSTTATDQINPIATAREKQTDESPASTTTAIATPITGNKDEATPITGNAIEPTSITRNKDEPTPITGPGKKYLITGTPGTGKSCFAYYLLIHLLAKEGNSVLYQNCHKDMTFFVVIRRSKDSEFEVEHYSNYWMPNNSLPKLKLGFLVKGEDSVEKRVSWYIFDSGHNSGAKPEITDVPTIVISSPDCDQYKLKDMLICPKNFYMPTWEWPEIDAVINQFHPDRSKEMTREDYSEALFKQLALAHVAFSKHGGVIREILNPYSEGRLEAALHKAIDQSDVNRVLQFLLARGDVSSAVSHRILHQKCDNKLKTGRVDYQNPSIGFASDYVFDRFWDKHLQKKADITLEQLSRMYEFVPADAKSKRRTNFGDKFEELVHRTLESGNHYGKPLKFGKNPKSKPIKLIFDSKVERESRYIYADPTSFPTICTIATKDADITAYVYPSSKTFPAIDAFLPGQKYLIQITIAEDHPVAVPELLAFIASRGWHPKETTLVFVVLDKIYASFQYQMPDDDDTLSEEQSSDFRKIRQYALPLPRLTSELRRNSSK